MRVPIRAYVTGAAGFVGKHLCDHLDAMGDSVIRADRSIDGLDITDADAIAASIAAARPGVVFHLAGQADVGSSWHSPNKTFDVNLNGTLNVLAAARAAGVERVVSVTSADIYGRVKPEQLPLDELTELRPVSPYAASKAAADMACLQAFLGYGQDVVRVRAFNHLGPGQGVGFVASALAKRIAVNEVSGSAEVKVGTLTARRDFTDVRDVARAYRLIAVDTSAGEVYNICSGSDHSIQELADKLLEQATIPMHLEVDPGLVRPVDLPVLRGSANKLDTATGWKPEIPLTTTLVDLLDWHRSEIRK